MLASEVVQDQVGIGKDERRSPKVVASWRAGPAVHSLKGFVHIPKESARVTRKGLPACCTGCGQLGWPQVLKRPPCFLSIP